MSFDLEYYNRKILIFSIDSEIIHSFYSRLDNKINQKWLKQELWSFCLFQEWTSDKNTENGITLNLTDQWKTATTKLNTEGIKLTFNGQKNMNKLYPSNEIALTNYIWAWIPWTNSSGKWNPTRLKGAQRSKGSQKQCCKTNAAKETNHTNLAWKWAPYLQSSLWDDSFKRLLIRSLHFCSKFAHKFQGKGESFLAINIPVPYLPNQLFTAITWNFGDFPFSPPSKRDPFQGKPRNQRAWERITVQERSKIRDYFQSPPTT